ncbi:carbohydrate ABC transporter permease [Streptomyces chartreusis]|uniref:carbohydrate ABC transporter permease n=1 Tax=Streptomyces chartreusis TaxID=1969 RepID=UPI00364F50C0
MKEATRQFIRAPRIRKARQGKDLKGTAYHLFSGVLATLFLMPIIWAILNSFKDTKEANQSPPTWFPQSWSLDNYAKFAEYGSGLGTYLWNSVLVSTLVVVGTVTITVLAGYGFARFQFRGKGLLFSSTLLILMVPHATLLIPLFMVLKWLQLTGTVFGLALVQIMFHLPFATFLMRNSFDSVPQEIEDAALVDGCGTLRAFRFISLPLAIPGIVTVALFTFIASWNEFLLPLVFLNGDDSFTLPVMLANLSTGQYGEVDWGALQAGVVIAMMPVLVLYLFLQRYYVAGLINGAIRG